MLQLKYHESGRDKVVDPEVGQWNMINKVKNGYIVYFLKHVFAQLMLCLSRKW